MKPSDRIGEIGRALVASKPRIYGPKGEWISTQDAIDLRIEAISRYLDEEHDKKCKHEYVVMSDGNQFISKCRYCGERSKL